MDSKPQLNVDAVKDQVRPCLKAYIEEFRKLSQNGMFSCIHPGHDDKHPSCSIDPKSGDTYWKCFSCGASGDIFSAAQWLEGKPASGAGWFHDNLIYLAKKFGVAVEELPEPAPEEMEKILAARAYQDAHRLVVQEDVPEQVAVKLHDYGWPVEVIRSLGIGGVEWNAYRETMVEKKGHSEELLKKVDLLNPKIFNAGNLIYTVKDEQGNPVAFAARNLAFTKEKQDAWHQQLEALGKNSPEYEEVQKARPVKFYNSSSADPLYQKSRRLFGFHVAKQFPHLPLFVFEGYSDVATAHSYGLKNSVCLGSVDFSDEHFDLVLGTKIQHIVFVLDADEAGEKGTRRFVRRLKEKLLDHGELKVEIIRMPEESDDPDKFIRTQGIEKFKDLPRLDIFSWEILRRIQDGQDKVLLAEEMLQQLARSGNSFEHYEKSLKLSVLIDIGFDVVWNRFREILDNLRQHEKINQKQVAQEVTRMLEHPQGDVETILREGLRKVGNLGSGGRNNSTVQILNYVDHLIEKAENRKNLVELSLGWPLFDSRVGGIPEEGALITVPGPPNQGKSSLLVNMAWRILENNPGKSIRVLYHTVDDAMRYFMARFCASRFSMPSRYFDIAGGFLDVWPELAPKYKEALVWFRDLVKSQRLIPLDTSLLGKAITDLQWKIEQVRNEFPTDTLIIFGDNFHLYDYPGIHKDGEAKIRAVSNTAKGLVTMYRCTVVMTMELPKNALGPGIRPTIQNIKGSSGMSYDSSANIGVYNDWKYRGDASPLVWTDTKHQEFDLATGTPVLVPEKKKPVIELVFDKSKVGPAFAGELYYQLYPESGRFEEADEKMQNEYQQKAESTRPGNNVSVPAPVLSQASAGGQFYPKLSHKPVDCETEDEMESAAAKF